MRIRKSSFFLFLFLLFLLLPACEDNTNPPPETQIGKIAPPFKLMDLYGKDFSLAKVKGDVVILRFWSTQCKSCREEMPKLEKIYQKLLPSGLTLLALNIADNPNKIKNFIKGLGLTYPILLDENKTVAKQYRVFGVPTSFVIDKDGIIRERFFGDIDEEELEKMITPFLNLLKHP